MALNDTHFFTAQGTLRGQAYVHTLHFREGVSSLGTNAQQQLIDRWQSTCQAPWLAAHGNDYLLVRLTAQKICGSPPLPARTEEGVGLTGTRAPGTAGDPLAPWLAVTVNESTALAGRSRHGRFFISGGYEGDVVQETIATTAGTWGALITSYVNALSTAFITGTPPLDWVQVVHSRKLASVPGTQCDASSTPVTGLGIVLRLTTQRSRRA